MKILLTHGYFLEEDEKEKEESKYTIGVFVQGKEFKVKANAKGLKDATLSIKMKDNTVGLGVQIGEPLEVEEDPPTVSDTDVDKALEEARQEAATFEVVEGRAAGRDRRDSQSAPARQFAPGKLHDPAQRRPAAVGRGQHAGGGGTGDGGVRSFVRFAGGTLSLRGGRRLLASGRNHAPGV